MKTYNIFLIVLLIICSCSCVTTRGQEVIVIKERPHYYNYGNGYYQSRPYTSRYTCTTRTYELRNPCCNDGDNGQNQSVNVYVNGERQTQNKPITETRVVDNEMRERMNYQPKTAEYNSYSEFQDECNRRERENPLINISDWKVTIHFYRNSSKMERETANEINIENVRDFLEKNPNACIVMDGYADIKTGSSEYNFKLASRRIHSVAAKLLQSPYISQNQIKVNVIGDKKQMYVENKWNRCVIIYPQLNNY